MDQELQDNVKIVAHWMGWTTYEGKHGLSFKHPDKMAVYSAETIGFHDNWQRQIPVWAKLQKEQLPEMGEIYEYYRAVDDDNPRAGFDTIVDIIKRIKN